MHVTRRAWLRRRGPASGAQVYPDHGPGGNDSGRYIDGEDVSKYEPTWQVTQGDGSIVTVESPHHFRHTLSTVFNCLARNGFIFLHLQEWMRSSATVEPGSWPHFTQTCPPFFDSFWRLEKN